MERIQQGRSATLSHTFYQDGVATNPSPDVATVTISRADGTAVVTNAAATEAGVGVVTYTLTPTQTALLDTLTVSWTASFGGLPQVFTMIVEVAGDFLFTISEMRAQSTKLANVTDYPVAKITAMRTLVEKAMEKRVGFALVPRYERETASATSGVLLPRWPYVRAIRSATTTSGTLTAGELAALTTDGVSVTGYSWPAGNVTVGYEHGRGNTDPEAGLAAMMLAKAWLMSGPVDDRALGFANESGGSFALATPGRSGSSFGLPFVDAFISENRLVAVG